MLREAVRQEERSLLQSTSLLDSGGATDLGHGERSAVPYVNLGPGNREAPAPSVIREDDNEENSIQHRAIFGSSGLINNARGTLETRVNDNAMEMARSRGSGGSIWLATMTENFRAQTGPGAGESGFLAIRAKDILADLAKVEQSR